MIKEEVIQRIKSVAKLSDFVREYTKLSRSGDQYSGLCPFHSERTPSFFIDSTDSVYYCFGCGAKGNVFTFLREKMGLDFQKALEFLAQRYNIPLEYETSNKKNPRFDLLSLAQAWFVEQLAGSDAAKNYLKGRDISDQDVQRFGLGFCPDGSGLTSYLVSKGVRIEELRALGLSKYSQGSGVLVDFFGNRIIFPIFDRIQRIRGFGGRAISAEQAPKYLNSPDSDTYKKSQSLFGSHLVRKVGRLYVVEGYFDVIRLWSNGLNSVCPCGTSLTGEQVRILESCADEIVFVFDGDLAGIRAAIKAALLTAPAVATVSFKLLPEGLDPDDFLRSRAVEEFTVLREFTPEELIIIAFSRTVGKTSVAELTRKELNHLSELIKEYISRISNPLISSRARAFFQSQIGLDLFADSAAVENPKLDIKDDSFIQLCLQNPALATLVVQDTFLVSELSVNDLAKLSELKVVNHNPEDALVEICGKKVTAKEVVEYIKQQALLKKHRNFLSGSLPEVIEGKRRMTKLLKT